MSFINVTPHAQALMRAIDIGEGISLGFGLTVSLVIRAGFDLSGGFIEASGTGLGAVLWESIHYEKHDYAVPESSE